MNTANTTNIMNRPYTTGDNNTTTFFIGNEVEQTPAYGMRTLFVVGLQSSSEIQRILNEQNSNIDSTKHIRHIYFGANMSFPHLKLNDYVNWKNWEKMISYFLELGYLCTLDFDVSCIEGIAESALCEDSNFIPMISVKVPYVQLLGYNAVVKIDDKGFNATNPGVWCHSLHELTKRQQFTSWSKYTQDQIIK
jgi:hypothetical protein